MTTLLRKIYEVLHCFSTATRQEMCNDLVRQLEKGTKPKDNLAAYFAEAIKSNQESFSQIDQPFIRKDRNTEKKGTNPVTSAMKGVEIVKIATPQPPIYEFTFREREVPHLRARDKEEQKVTAYIDYVADTERRPILGEIKWKDDEDAFYALIQLLTYLSEMATSNQIERAIKHRLFRETVTNITAFDLHIFLANFNDRGKKGQLIESTRKLAELFSDRLRTRHADIASCLGNILCISAHIENGSESFSKENIDCRWMI